MLSFSFSERGPAGQRLPGGMPILYIIRDVRPMYAYRFRFEPAEKKGKFSLLLRIYHGQASGFLFLLQPKG